MDSKDRPVDVDPPANVEMDKRDSIHSIDKLLINDQDKIPEDRLEFPRSGSQNSFNSLNKNIEGGSLSDVMDVQASSSGKEDEIFDESTPFKSPIILTINAIQFLILALYVTFCYLQYDPAYEDDIEE